MDGALSLKKYRKVEAISLVVMLSGLILTGIGCVFILVCGALGINSIWVIGPLVAGMIALLVGPIHSLSQERLVKKAYDDLGFEATCSNKGEMVVTRVTDGANAFLAGLRSGDILVSIAGNAVGAGSGFNWRIADIYEKFLNRGSVDFVALRIGNNVAVINGVIKIS